MKTTSPNGYGSIFTLVPLPVGQNPSIDATFLWNCPFSPAGSAHLAPKDWFSDGGRDPEGLRRGRPSRR